MIRAQKRLLFIAVILLVLLAVLPAHAADCQPGCSCMLPSDAKLMGYEPCGGKLTTICGYDPYRTAKYCYATYRAAPTPATGKQGLPNGWYAYHANARAQKDDGTWVTVDTTFRYDISSETYNGRSATRIKMNMQTTSSEGSGRISTDIYTDPVSYAVLGGTATATMGGKTQTINVADIAATVNTNSGVSYSQPGQFSTSDIDEALRLIARETGGRVTKTTESVTTPAGTFPSATKHSISVYDPDQGTTTMNFWTAQNVPVLLKMQARAGTGGVASTMELTGYKVTGSTSSAGSPGGVLSGGEGNALNPFDGELPEDFEEFQDAILDAIQQSLNGAGLGAIDIERVPSAAAESVVPAAFGAAGALAGIGFGALTLVPPGGFPEPGSRQEGGGDGMAGGVTRDGEPVLQEAPVEGPDRSASEVVSAGGPDALEQAALAAGSDTTGGPGAPQLSSLEGGSAAIPDEATAEPEETQTGSIETPQEPEEIPQGSVPGAPVEEEGTPTETGEEEPEAQSPPEKDEQETLQSAQTESLEDQVTQLEQLQDLRSAVDQIIIKRTQDGYFIRNPHLPVKIWNWTIGGVYNWLAGNTGGQCGEAAGWGREWISNDVRRIFGNNALVEEIIVNPNGYSNHASTQVVLPNGDRYIVDMWQGMHEGSSRIYKEDEWLATWKERIGGNPPVLRNNYEIQLEDSIRAAGNVREGIENFMHDLKNSENAKITVRSYTKNPWFVP